MTGAGGGGEGSSGRQVHSGKGLHLLESERLVPGLAAGLEPKQEGWDYGMAVTRNVGTYIPASGQEGASYELKGESLRYCPQYSRSYGFPGGSKVKNPPSKQETWVQSLDQEDPLEKEMGIHFSILTWEIP